MKEPSNIPTALLRIKLLNYVMEHDYYHSDWFNVNEAEQDLLNNKITNQEYDKYIDELLVYWS